MIERPVQIHNFKTKPHEYRSLDTNYIGSPKIILKGYTTELDRIQVNLQRKLWKQIKYFRLIILLIH